VSDQAPVKGGGGPSSAGCRAQVADVVARDQRRRQTDAWRGNGTQLLRIVFEADLHGHALGRWRVLLPPDVGHPAPGQCSTSPVRRVFGGHGRGFSTEADATPPSGEVVGAMTLRVIQAALAQKRPDGRWFTPDAVLQVADHVLDARRGGGDTARGRAVSSSRSVMNAW